MKWLLGNLSCQDNCPYRKLYPRWNLWEGQTDYSLSEFGPILVLARLAAIKPKPRAIRTSGPP